MKVIILTEGGKNIGFGHIARCTALYQAFEEQNVIPEFIINGDDSVKDLLKGKKYRILHWLEEKERVLDIMSGADIAIIDSYLADLEFYKKVSNVAKIPVYIDDTKRIDYPKGIVINGSIYTEEVNYPRKDNITYLLGSRFVFLRKEFWKVSKKKIKKNVESVMVTFGGGDIEFLTPKIMKFLNKNYTALIKNIIIGNSFRNIKEIKTLKDGRTNLIYRPDAEGMKKVMLESDIAISAGGQTLYELARVGVPTVGICLVENQKRNLRYWQKTGFIEYIGYHNKKDIYAKLKYAIEDLLPKRERLKRSRIARDIIDGRGTARIYSVLTREKVKND